MPVHKFEELVVVFAVKQVSNNTGLEFVANRVNPGDLFLFNRPGTTLAEFLVNVSEHVSDFAL